MLQTTIPAWYTLDAVLRAVRKHLPTKKPTPLEDFVALAAAAWDEMIQAVREQAVADLWEVVCAGPHVRLIVNADNTVTVVCTPPFYHEDDELDEVIHGLHQPFFIFQLIYAMRRVWAFDWEHCLTIIDERYRKYWDEDALLYEFYLDANLSEPPAFDADFAAQWYASDTIASLEVSKYGDLPLFG